MIKERIIQLIELKGIPKENFYTEIGMTSANFRGKAKESPLNSNAIENILSKIPDANPEWLLTGKEPMLKQDHFPVAIKTNDKNGIPLLAANAMAGVFTGDVQVMDYECERYIIPVFKGADFLIPIKGSSMYPKYSSGDIVACKKLESWSFFQYGKVYVVYTSQGAIIKRILASEQPDHIKIFSENEARYPPFDLHKKEIRGVAIVIGVIRLE